jgi:hypothetical protein
MILIVLTCSFAHQDSVQGQDFNELLDYPPTAKSVSMAGAVSSLADDYSAIVYSPATLGFASAPELRSTLVYRPSSLIPDRLLLGAGAIYPITKRAAVNAQLAYSGETEVLPGTPRSYAVAGRVSCGVRLRSDISVGASIDIVRDATRYYPWCQPEPVFSSAMGWGIDASVLYKTPIPTVNLALCVLNLGPDVDYSGGYGSSRCWQVVKVGASVEPAGLNLHGLTLSSDLSRTKKLNRDRDWRLNVGAEWNVLNPLFLRGGYFRESGPHSGFGLGGGLRILDQVVIDVARHVPSGEYGEESGYFFTVTFVPSAPGGKARDLGPE